MTVPDSWVVIGRLGRPQGIKGQVTVEVHTDIPEVRFAVGERLLRDGAAPLTVAALAWHQGRLLLAIEGVADRNAAETLRDTVVYLDRDTDTYVDDDPDSFAELDLVGLAARHDDAEGTEIGRVSDVLHPPGGDLLVVTRPDGSELLVPFVLEVVPVVDVAAGHVVLTPPEGLYEL